MASHLMERNLVFRNYVLCVIRLINMVLDMFIICLNIYCVELIGNIVGFLRKNCFFYFMVSELIKVRFFNKYCFPCSLF